tara:strand:- start:357 stop:476 length:120 start_codon:yes stop_codon:yes gene_type:complete
MNIPEEKKEVLNKMLSMCNTEEDKEEVKLLFVDEEADGE